MSLKVIYKISELVFGGSLLIRNIFRGAETFEISTRGSIGSSSDAADSEDRFLIYQKLEQI